MPAYRSLVLAASAVLAAGSLAAAGTTASAALTRTAPSSHAIASRSVVPPVGAPHIGRVSGVRYGTDSQLNDPAAVRAFKALHDQLLGTHLTARLPADTIHKNIGTSFNLDTSGAQATQSVSTKIHAGPQTSALYTPTLFPSGGSSRGSCIEISTAYRPGFRSVAAWDWCQAIMFVAHKVINKSFLRTYAKQHNYSVQILQTDPSNNTWTAFLYNYEAARWEKFYSQRGTSYLRGYQGWDLYELYSEIKEDGQSYACDDLEGKRVESRGIRVGVDGTLVRADPTNADNDYDVPLEDFQCDSLTYQMIRPFSHWKAIG